MPEIHDTIPVLFYAPTPRNEPGFAYLEKISCLYYADLGFVQLVLVDVRNSDAAIYRFCPDAPNASAWAYDDIVCDDADQLLRQASYEQIDMLRKLPHWQRRHWYRATWSQRWGWMRTRLPRLRARGDLEDMPFN